MQHLDTLLIILPLALLLAVAREWDAFMAQDAADYAAFRVRIAAIRRGAYVNVRCGACDALMPYEMAVAAPAPAGGWRCTDCASPAPPASPLAE